MSEETEQAETQSLGMFDDIRPVMSVEEAKAKFEDFENFVKTCLINGLDYGELPGTDKKNLLKPGAEKICDRYGLTDTYEVTNRTEDWDRKPPLFDLEIRCNLTSRRSGKLITSGFGSCNTYESKYLWRKAARTCPECGSEQIIKGKKEFGGGWLCWMKKGGCGARYGDDDPRIKNQETGRVENDDIPTLKNTILKMAKKRAKIDATLSATRSSGLFTQDMEDITPEPKNGAAETKTALPPPKTKAFPKDKPASEPESPPTEGGYSTVSGVVISAKVVTKKGYKILEVEILDKKEKYTTFDDKKMDFEGSMMPLFQFLPKYAIHKYCEFEVVQKQGKFWNIMRVLRVGKYSWEPDGILVINQDDEVHETLETDDDVPF